MHNEKHVYRDEVTTASGSSSSARLALALGFPIPSDSPRPANKNWFGKWASSSSERFCNLDTSALFKGFVWLNLIVSFCQMHVRWHALKHKSESNLVQPQLDVQADTTNVNPASSSKHFLFFLTAPFPCLQTPAMPAISLPCEPLVPEKSRLKHSKNSIFQNTPQKFACPQKRGPVEKEVSSSKHWFSGGYLSFSWEALASKLVSGGDWLTDLDHLGSSPLCQISMTPVPPTSRKTKAG